MRNSLICLVILMVVCDAARAQQAPDQGPTVSDQLIQQVLEPLQTGMQNQNVDQVLSAFDKQELSSYSDLEAQLQTFFQKFADISLRYQLLQVTAGKDHASATLDMEMDALPYELTEVAVRRSTQMRLQLKLGPKGWKIASFSPGDFFNVEYSAR